MAGKTLDLITRFVGVDAGLRSGYVSAADAAKMAAASTKDYEVAQSRAVATDKAAADAAVRASDLRIQASAALREAQRLEATGDTEAAEAAERNAYALKLQAQAARATSLELNASAIAAGRQAAALKVSRDEGIGAYTNMGSLSHAGRDLSSSLESIPTPVTMAAGALGKLGVAAGGVAVAVGAFSLDQAVKFQTAMTRLHTQANVSTAGVAAMSKGVLALAGSVAETPQTLAAAAYHIASIGQNSLTTAQQLKVLQIASEGAKLGGADLVDVTNALDAAIVAHIKGVTDYSQAMGALNATVGAGDMTMQDLADAFGPLGSTFKGFGVSIQQAGAALATFGDNNLRGALAGSQLRQSITALAHPLNDGVSQLQAWGLKSGNLTKQLAHGGLTDALDVLAKKLHNAGYTAKTMGPILADMFGKRGPQMGLSILINELDRYHNKLDEVSKGAAGFGSSWAGYTKTFSYNLDSAKSAVDALAIQLGDKLLPDATRAMHWLATDGVADLTRFGHWFEANRSTIFSFGAEFVTVMRDIEFATLGTARGILDGMTHAMGWIPGLGGKLKKADAAFDLFESTTENTMNSLAAKLNAAGEAAGANLGAGVDQGIRSYIKFTNAAAASMGAQAVSEANRAMGNHSPSVLMQEAGKNLDLGLAKGITDNASVVTKPIHDVAKLLFEGLSGGWTGEAAHIKDALTTPVQNALDHLNSMLDAQTAKDKARTKAAESTLKQTLSARAAAITSAKQAITGSIDFSSLFGTDANGNATVGNLGSLMSSSLGPIQGEAKDMALLRKKGLSQFYLDQISALPPSQALALEQQILSGQDGSIASLNATAAAITASAKQTATTVVDSPTEMKTIKNQEHAVKVAERSEKILERIERHMEHQAASGLAAHLTVDSSGHVHWTSGSVKNFVKELNKELQSGRVKIRGLK